MKTYLVYFKDEPSCTGFYLSCDSCCKQVLFQLCSQVSSVFTIVIRKIYEVKFYFKWRCSSSFEACHQAMATKGQYLKSTSFKHKDLLGRD